MIGRVSAGMASLAASALVVAAMAAPAHAMPDGVLVVDPPSGTLTSPITLSTAGVCERGVGFVVTVEGEGVSEDAGNLVGMTMLDALSIDPRGVHTVAVTTTLGEYFLGASGGLPTGKYDLVFVCRNKLDLDPLQTFTATLKVGKDGTYTALGDSQRPLEEILEEIDFTPPPPRPGDDALIAPPTQQQTESPEVVETAAEEGDPGSLRNTLLVVGALLLAGAISAWFIVSRKERHSNDGEHREAEADA